MNAFINFAATTLNSGLSAISPSLNVDENLKGYTPITVITLTIIGTLGLQALIRYTNPRWKETRPEQIGRLSLKTNYATNKLNEKIDQEYQRELKHVLARWKTFGEPFTEIPKDGLSFKELKSLIKSYDTIVRENFKGKQISGTVYSNNFTDETESIVCCEYEKLKDLKVDHPLYFSQLTNFLRVLHTYVSDTSHSWNALHQNEFGIADFIKYQVGKMVGSMYGGTPNDNFVGFVTTGGTGSLMTAARIYRNRGMKIHGHAPGEGIIVAPVSVHAAIEKSAEAYLLNVEYINVSEDGVVDLKQLKQVLARHGNKVVMVVGSAPEYSSGCVNQLEEMAKIANQENIPIHGDFCLGGFLVHKIHPNLKNSLKYLTSLSCDTHKNGFAPKGSSVLLMDEEYAKFSFYKVPKWDGGVYVTLSDPGSEACTSAFNAFVTMLAVGENGYKKAAESIHANALEFANVVKDFEGKLRLLADPQVNVVALTIAKDWMGKGAIYALAHEMAKRGFVFNTMPNDRIHFCITLRYCCDENVNERLKNAFTESIEEVERQKNEGIPFPGDAGMYCSLGKALNPSHEDSFQERMENVFLGKYGASEALSAYCLALLNAFRKSNPYPHTPSKR